jgi:hypothetical protein
MARHAKLPNEKDVERHTERTRHLEGDWNSAAGQGQNHHITPAFEMAEE